MGTNLPNSTNYQHPHEPNLLDLHNAMEYDAQGKPVIRVEVKGLSFDGNVDMTQVEINNDVGNPIPVSKDTNANASGNPLFVNVVNEVEIKNDANNPLPISKNTTANSPSNPISTNNFLLDVSAGRVPGHSIVFISGRNRTTAVNVAATVWEPGGLYPWSVWDAGAGTLTVVSNNAADTDITLLLSGLDSNYAIQTEVVTVNGKTTVTTTKSFYRLNSAVNIGSKNVTGTVTIARNGTTVGQIINGANTTKMGIYTVPAGYTAFSVYGDFSVSKNEAAELNAHWRFFGGVFIDIYSVQIYQAALMALPPYPGAIPEKTDIDNRIQYATAKNTAVYSNQQLLLIDNTYL